MPVKSRYKIENRTFFSRNADSCIDKSFAYWYFRKSNKVINDYILFYLRPVLKYAYCNWHSVLLQSYLNSAKQDVPLLLKIFISVYYIFWKFSPWSHHRKYFLILNSNAIRQYFGSARTSSHRLSQCCLDFNLLITPCICDSFQLILLFWKKLSSLDPYRRCTCYQFLDVKKRCLCSVLITLQKQVALHCEKIQFRICWV
jgi:hypothetical protein